MIDELNKAFEDYQTKWNKLVSQRTDKPFFESLKPTAIAWKTEDLADFDRRFAELREHCDQIHLGWINERWLGTLHLRGSELIDGVKLIKLMQRRPGSTDATGLDHIDFYSPEVAQAETVLTGETALKWTSENNGHCDWISIWFDDTEAKLRTATTIDVCIAELQEVNEKLLAD